jgi:hypothetical protein
MTDANSLPLRVIQITGPTASGPRSRRRHHDAVIQAEVRRLASAQLDALSTSDTDAYRQPHPPPAA